MSLRTPVKPSSATTNRTAVSPSTTVQKSFPLSRTIGHTATPTSPAPGARPTSPTPKVTLSATTGSPLTELSPPDGMSATIGHTSTRRGSASAGSQNIKVYVRLRDYNTAEKENWIPNDLSVRMKDSTCEVTVPGRGKFPFTFDECFWSNSIEEPGKAFTDQEDLYNSVGIPLVDNVLGGFNSSIIAYGQTGSGKTHSIFGPANDPEGSKKGLIPRVCDGIFSRLAAEGQSSSKQTVSVTMLEVYLEEVYDLLAGRKKLAVRQDTPSSFGVVGAKTYEVKSYVEVLKLIEKGDSQKTFAATAMNERSSRAHTLFQLNVTVATALGSRSAKVMLADLAGCERIKIAKTDTGTALDEACNINLSLLTLGTCIEAAVQRSKQGKSIDNMGEFRQSTLTKLLKDFIGGNSRTAMLVAIAPALKDVSLTLQALRFADRAKQIATHAKINYVSNKDPNNKLADEALKGLYDRKKELLDKEFELEIAQQELVRRQDDVAEMRLKLEEERRTIDIRSKMEQTSEEERKMLQARLTEIEASLKGMTQELLDMEKEKDSMRDRILEVCQDNAAIVSDKEALERKVTELTLQLIDLQNERNEEALCAQDECRKVEQEMEVVNERLVAREAYHTRIAKEEKAATDKAFMEMKEGLEASLLAAQQIASTRVAELEAMLADSEANKATVSDELAATKAAFASFQSASATSSEAAAASHTREVEILNAHFSAKVSSYESKLASAHSVLDHHLHEPHAADLLIDWMGRKEDDLMASVQSLQLAAHTSATEHIVGLLKEHHDLAAALSANIDKLTHEATAQTETIKARDSSIQALSAEKDALEVSVRQLTSQCEAQRQEQAAVASAFEATLGDMTVSHAAAVVILKDSIADLEGKLEAAAATITAGDADRESLRRNLSETISKVSAWEAKASETKLAMEDAAVASANLVQKLRDSHEVIEMESALKHSEERDMLQANIAALSADLTAKLGDIEALSTKLAAEEAEGAKKASAIIGLKANLTDREAEMAMLVTTHANELASMEQATATRVENLAGMHSTAIAALEGQHATVSQQQQRNAEALAHQASAAQEMIRQALLKFHSASSNLNQAENTPSSKEEQAPPHLAERSTNQPK